MFGVFALARPTADAEALDSMDYQSIAKAHKYTSGVLFVTYNGLIAGTRSQTATATTAAAPVAEPVTSIIAAEAVSPDRGATAGALEPVAAVAASPSGGAGSKDGVSRMDQVVKWFKNHGGNGTIVFDEAHRARSAGSDEEKNSKTSQAVSHLQRRLPNARVVYATATSAGDIKSLGYMERLGLWGPGAPFADFSAFQSTLGKVGVAALEAVSGQLRRRGSYIARTLSYDGTECTMLACTPEDGFSATYDAAARVWSGLIDGFEASVEANEMSGRQLAVIWGMHQVAMVP